MRIGSGTAAVMALALIAAGDVYGARLGSDQAGKPAWPWRLTQQAEPSTPPAQPAKEATPADEPLTVFIDGPSGFTFVWDREGGWKFVGKIVDKGP